jgi:two-component system NtrC family response regulator
LIDDEAAQRTSLSTFLTKRQHQVHSAASGEIGLSLYQNEGADLILTDFRMPGMNGLEVVRAIKELNPEALVVVITAFSETSEAVDVMKAGAWDYLAKPIDLNDLQKIIDHVEERKILLSENLQLKARLEKLAIPDNLIFGPGPMEEVVNLSARIAETTASVLIRGESGTGKEQIARLIHNASPRANQNFLAVNCAAIPENLIESELFGHEKGAFTGAGEFRKGRFEEASLGTLFIDEIGDLPLAVQVKLLRVIQEGTLERLGSSKPIKVDVRLLSATHRDLRKMISEGSFREDLYYRLNVMEIAIPPLRKRKSDINLLMNHFLNRFSQMFGRTINGFTTEAKNQLLRHNYPGNVRELENIIQRSVALCRENLIDVKDLPFLKESVVNDQLMDYTKGYEELVTAFEIKMVEQSLLDAKGNQSEAARNLKISERHLRSRMQKLGIENKFR